MKEMKTLTLNGKTYDSFHDAEARERLDELEQNGAVKTVNGISPDENGNVEIPVSGGNVENGEDGFSPIATVEQTDNGAVISITDKNGTTTATITNGKDGKDGADGQPGKDGADGAPGEKGDKGDKGDPGEPGQKGEQGIQGIPGEKGDKGEKGDTGAPGADGAKGDKGDKGDTGATGAQGEPGKDGANGKDGTSATHSWNGTVLTVTSASGTSSADLKGEKGDKGDKGEQGIQGIQGEPGEKGDKGDTGATGSTGTSVTVKSVSESTADGGSNVVTFSDGKTLTVKNGSKGSQGATGKTAYQYAQDGGFTGTETEFSAKLASEVSNPLWGKRVSFNGDSICAGHDGNGGYGAIIANRNNMTYENIAHGGATITAETYSGSTGNALHWICRTISQMNADSDYAIVEGGINDPNYVTNMGSLSDGFDAVLDDTTFYGAFESMLKQLVTRFAGKKIGYIAIPKVSSNFDSRGDADNCYHIALECCEKWGVPVCDLNVCVPPMGYIDALSDTYTTDGTHPNEAGYKAYYCDQIEAWMKNLAVTSKSTKSAVKEHNTDEKAHADIRGLLKKLQSGKLNSEGVSVKTIRTALADGTLVDIDVLVVSEGAAVIPYTNRVPTSIGTDGAVYNGVGYKNGYRLNSYGTEKELVSATVTGFIKAKAGDTIRIQGYKWYNTTAATCYLCAYNGDFSKAYVGNSQSNYDTTAFIESMNYDEATGISTVVLKPGLTYEYIRLSVFYALLPDGANLIVTVNEEITE